MSEFIEWVKSHLILTVYFIISTMLILLFMISLYFSKGTETESTDEVVEQFISEVEDSEKESDTSDTEQKEVNDLTENTVMIELKGAIVKPGVYELKSGDRLIDAIELAGGLIDKADDRTINQALLLTDQMMIYIPIQGEEVLEANHTLIPSTETESAPKVNINEAEKADLTELNGIGESRAQSIIDYREENGLFKKIEEIKNVTGIGEKIFENLKEQIRVD